MQQHTPTTIALIEEAASRQYGIPLRVVAPVSAQPFTPATAPASAPASVPAAAPRPSGVTLKQPARHHGASRTGYSSAQIRTLILGLYEGGASVLRLADVRTAMKADRKCRTTENLIYYAFTSLALQGKVARVTEGGYKLLRAASAPEAPKRRRSSRPSARRVRDEIRTRCKAGPTRPADVCAALGFNRDTRAGHSLVTRALNALLSRGEIYRVQKGVYQAVPQQKARPA